MASRALRIRFSTTCWICIRSAITRSDGRRSGISTRTCVPWRPTAPGRWLPRSAWQALDPPFGLAAGHEVAQATDDLSCPQRLIGGLSIASRTIGDVDRLGLQAGGAIRSDSWRRPTGAGSAHGPGWRPSRPSRSGATCGPVRLAVPAAGPRSAAVGQVAHEAGEVACSPERISPTDSSMGKVDPSLRSPTTTRPTPMIRLSPVVR